MRRIALIVNPISGRAGRQRAKIEIIRYAKRLARQLGDDLYLHLSRYHEHALTLAREEVRCGASLVIAVGGDGTVNEVARGLIGSHTALGIVPMGSGNGLARHLALPLLTRAALKETLMHAPIPMDCGLLNGKPFFTTAGIGFDAEVGWMFANLGTRGLNSYIKATAQLFFNYSPRDYHLTVDGREIQTTALLVTFANASQFGNNARIAPHALVNDGKLNLVIVKPFPKLAIGYLASLLFHGLVDSSSYIETIPFQHLEVRCDAPLRGHIDGEPEQLPPDFEVTIHPNALQVVPGAYATEVCGDPAPAILIPYQYLNHLPRPAPLARRLRKSLRVTRIIRKGRFRNS